ncbi:ComEC/Rec2 family competence protein [bacterium]|nr:ComEC/Rec2 family competence protein [bacterium]
MARFLPQENASLVLGLVLGSSMADFTSGFKAIIKQLGLSHMVAVSGFHLGVLFAFTSGIFTSIFSRKLAVLATIIFLAWYSLLVSTPLSLVRALFMLILSLIGRNYFYKYTNSFLILLQVFLFMSLLSVLNIFNVGLQLSFLSTAGIQLFANYFSCSSSVFALTLRENFLKTLLTRLVVLIKASILTSLSAQLMSLPVIINVFGELAPLGFVSTLIFSSLLTFLVCLSVPLLSFSIMTGTYNYMFYLIGPLYLFLSDLSGFCMKLLTLSADWMGHLVSVRFSFGWTEIAIYYGLIACFVWFWRQTGRRCQVYVV